MPDPATAQGEHIFLLWRWAWIAALATGAVVWGLIFYACWRYHRRSDDEVPVQTRYNLPLEIFYTIAPVVMVIVFFVHTVDTQNAVLDDEGEPDHTVYVVGQQWQWTFNYKDTVDGQQGVWETGTMDRPATLWLPVNESVHFDLNSPDVIHSFWVPSFYFKLDVIPGRTNKFELTPTRIGTFEGKCAELCGLYHSRMVFSVKVVSRDEYDTHLRELAARGQTGAATGGSDATTIPGTGEGEK